MKLFPHQDYVLVRPTSAGVEWTSQGLYLPETAREKVNRGTVLATGPKVRDLNSGDEVYYSPFAVTELGLDSWMVVMCREKETIAKVVDE